MLKAALKIKIIEAFRTQADFALSVSEHESFVSRVLRGRQHLSEEKKERWSKALGCKTDKLFEV